MRYDRSVATVLALLSLLVVSACESSDDSTLDGTGGSPATGGEALEPEAPSEGPEARAALQETLARQGLERWEAAGEARARPVREGTEARPALEAVPWTRIPHSRGPTPSRSWMAM